MNVAALENVPDGVMVTVGEYAYVPVKNCGENPERVPMKQMVTFVLPSIMGPV